MSIGFELNKFYATCVEPCLKAWSTIVKISTLMISICYVVEVTRIGLATLIRAAPHVVTFFSLLWIVLYYGKVESNQLLLFLPLKPNILQQVHLQMNLSRFKLLYKNLVTHLSNHNFLWQRVFKLKQQASIQGLVDDASSNLKQNDD